MAATLRVTRIPILENNFGAYCQTEGSQLNQEPKLIDVPIACIIDINGHGESNLLMRLNLTMQIRANDNQLHLDEVLEDLTNAFEVFQASIAQRYMEH